MFKKKIYIDLWVYSISGMLHRSPGNSSGFNPTWLQKFTTPKTPAYIGCTDPQYMSTPIGQVSQKFHWAAEWWGFWLSDDRRG